MDHPVIQKYNSSPHIAQSVSRYAAKAFPAFSFGPQPGVHRRTAHKYTAPRGGQHGLDDLGASGHRRTCSWHGAWQPTREKVTYPWPARGWQPTREKSTHLGLERTCPVLGRNRRTRAGARSANDSAETDVPMASAGLATNSGEADAPGSGTDLPGTREKPTYQGRHQVRRTTREKLTYQGRHQVRRTTREKLTYPWPARGWQPTREKPTHLGLERTCPALGRNRRTRAGTRSGGRLGRN